ncbi:MAG: HAD family hydrolase [Lentisphaerae bacterium]|nr:HAD family hydrolase [Lentisphaerota bacterium]MCP4099973.1 HAD family hydrolase [Lentisphaerota bacterium]
MMTYNKEDVKKIALDLVKEISANINLSIKKNNFNDIEQIFLKSVNSVIYKYKLKIKAKDIVFNLIKEHSKAPLYNDTLFFLERITKKYSVIISSDACEKMVKRITEKMPGIRKVYLSDNLKCYKGDKSGKFFQAIMKDFTISENEILHIGDSYGEIDITNKLKIKNCLVIRDKKRANYSLNSSYTVTSLTEVLEILDTDN